MPSPSPFTTGERATLVGVVVLFTIIGFAETAVIAVLPTAAKDLGGIGAFGWLLTGFLAAKIVGLVLAGQYSDSHGARPVLAVGLVLFTVGVVVGGLAPTMTVLVVGRVVTGVGDGLLLTGVYVVIGQVFSDDASPRVQTAIGTSFVVPTLAGPVIAGTVAQLLTWRLSFLGLVPFILVAVVLMLPLLRSADPAPAQPARRNSLPYAIAVAAAIAVLEGVGQRRPPWPVLIAVAAPTCALLGWGLRGVVPAGTFRMRRGVAAPIALRAIFGGAFFGGTALIPLMMTLQHGYAASVAALPVAVADLMWAAGSWMQARTPKGDDGEYRVRLVRVGFALTALGLLVGAAVAFSAVPGWLMFPGWGVAALGAGMTFATFNVLVLRHTTDADRGFDSAASQLSGSAGQSVTMGVAGVLIAAAAQGSVGFDTAFASVYAGMALMLVFGCAAAGRLRAPVQTAARVLA